ncbi:FxSxx-COOH cyclophane-containing RiPP peptide [Streptomyces sp. CA-111067]|jgi:FXSXX-COOH protein|uniref:FxSxx-COOH cyclophane-containing RiPP peptide n=1 Tax=Streptomyces sp. CA-111067 TaxID=3240046 RepID=UPI003D977F43
MEQRPYGAAEGYDPAAAPVPDLLGMDLEALRTTEHPVLAELVSDLRERIAAPGAGALWGFDNSM